MPRRAPPTGSANGGESEGGRLPGTALAVEGPRGDTKVKGASKIVTFRVSRSQWERLAEEAERRKQSVGACARHHVFQSLEGSGDKRLERRLGEIRQRLWHLQVALARATHVLLVDGGGKCEEQDAREWVLKELLNDDALDDGTLDGGRSAIP